MVKKPTLGSKKTSVFIDLVFITLLFFLPITAKIGFNISIIDIRVVSILTIAFWGLIKGFTSKLSLQEISLFDIGVFVFVAYCILHFILYSEVSVYYYKFWIYFAYLGVFYMFRWTLNRKKTSGTFIQYILYIIIITSLCQSIVGLFQFFEILKVKNEFFTLLGSFTSPNFFGAYLGLGFIALVWCFLVKKINKKVILILGVLSLVLFLCLIVLSKSRTTWLAVMLSLIVLIITSKESKSYLVKVTPFKKILAGIGILIIIVFGVKFSYDLKPESVKGRTLVAKISLQEIVRQPIKGHGLFSFAGNYNKAKANYFSSENRPWDEKRIGTYVFTPFNDYILVAFELGILAFILAMSLILFVILKTKINIHTRLGLALFVNVCVLALFSSPLNGMPIMFIGLFGLALVFRYGEFERSFKLPTSIANYIFKPLTVIACLVGIYLVTFKLVNQNKFKGYSIEKGSIEEFFQLSHAIEDNMFSGFFIGKKLYDSGYQGEGIKYIEKAFKKSSAPKIGRVLASLYIKESNYKRAEEIYKLNINVEPYRYEGRMDLLKLFIRSNQYRKAIKLAQEIVDFPVKIPSKEVEDYKLYASKTIKQYSKNVKSIPYDFEGSLSGGKIVTSQILNMSLPYKVYLPPIHKIESELPIIYINDGYNYIRKGNLHKVIDSLIVNNRIEPIVAVFLDPRDKQDNWKNKRQELFLCNPSFVNFFNSEFIPKIEKLYPVSKNRDDRTVLGVSFGGLAALYLVDENPNSFKNIVMQSPAFHPCQEIYKSYASKPKKDFKMYLSYGTGKDTEKQDIPMIKILKQKNYDLKVNVIDNGDHNWSVWKEQLDDILIYFFGFDSLEAL